MADPVAITLRVAADRYSMTPRQLRALIDRGVLPAIRPPGARAFVVLVADVERLFAPVAKLPKEKRVRETESQRITRQLRQAGVAV